jgi:RNA polymerase sigma factor (sigma-70 family)
MEDYSDYSAPELVRMLGGRFKDYRLRANMTQKEVADLLGISQSYISRLEKKIMKRLKKEIAKYE